jgi:hypothetical protein
MAERERAQNRHKLAERLERRAREYEDDALLVRELTRRGFAGTAGGAAEEKEAVGRDGEAES